MSGSYEAYSAAMERSYAVIEQEMETLRSEIADEYRTEAERLREHGYIVKIEVQFGEPAQRIIQYTNDEQIGLVAMATHGPPGVSRLVLGSVAEHVYALLRRLSCCSSSRITPQQSVAHQLAGLALGNSGRLRLAVATDGSTFSQRAIAVHLQW